MKVTRIIHAVAATLALGIIASFWASTVIAELLMGPVMVVAVKTKILLGLTLLIPALITTTVTGQRLAKRCNGSHLVGRKQARMRFVAPLGIGVLVPCAFVLQSWAVAGSFGPRFMAVQLLELAAGATNIVLLVQSYRDGLRLRATKRVKRSRCP